MWVFDKARSAGKRALGRWDAWLLIPAWQEKPLWASGFPLEDREHGRGWGSPRATHSRPWLRVLGTPPYLLGGEGQVGGPENWLGPGPGLQEQKGLRPGAQRGVGRWVAAHLLHTEVLRGIQELQGCGQVDGVQGLLVTVH